MSSLRLGVQGGTLRQEFVAVLERVKDTDKAHVFIHVNKVAWGAGLRLGLGGVGSREAMRHQGSFSYYLKF